MIETALTALKAVVGLPERSALYEAGSKNEPGKMGKGKHVYFDVVESESWSASANVTAQPIKNNTDVSYNIKVDPDTVSIQATLTNHTGINSLNPASLSRIKSFGVDDIVSENLQLLEKWRENGTILTYSGSVKDDVENCVITTLSATRSSSTGDALELSISLKKIVLFEEQNFLGSSLPASAKPTQKKGRLTTKTTPGSVADYIASLF